MKLHLLICYLPTNNEIINVQNISNKKAVFSIDFPISRKKKNKVKNMRIQTGYKKYYAYLKCYFIRIVCTQGNIYTMPKKKIKKT